MITEKRLQAYIDQTGNASYLFHRMLYVLVGEIVCVTFLWIFCGFVFVRV
jgi:hypothetical protein